MGAATAAAVEQHGRQRTEREAFVDWCFEASPENTEPSEDVLRARETLRHRTRKAGGKGYIQSLQDVEACVDRMVARSRLPEYQEAIREPPATVRPDLPPGCPIITTPKPVTDDMMTGPFTATIARTFDRPIPTAAEANRAAREFCDREQARLAAEFEDRNAKANPPTSDQAGEARAEARAMRRDGMTVGQVAEALGVSKRTVYRWGMSP